MIFRGNSSRTSTCLIHFDPDARHFDPDMSHFDSDASHFGLDETH